jgi:hypothetical protein
MVLAGGGGAGDFSWDLWAIDGQDPSTPWVLPAVGRQLRGCERVFWHHVRLNAAQASPQVRDVKGRLRARMWQLQVQTRSGGLELDHWRIQPLRFQKDSAREREREAGKMVGHEEVVASGDGLRGRGDRQVAFGEMGHDVSPREGGGEERSGEELDANAIAQRWDVDKVQSFIGTFRDEFGENNTAAYQKIFREQSIDGAALLGLTMSDLESIGIHSQPHRLLLLKEIESHLLACGRRAIGAPQRPAGKAEDAYPGFAPRQRVDPVRALLQSLRADFGDSRTFEYHALLSGHGIRVHADLLALDDHKLQMCGIKALSHRKMLLARAETLKLLPSPEERLAEVSLFCFV